jgi:hypothetical protein
MNKTLLLTSASAFALILAAAAPSFAADGAKAQSQSFVDFNDATDDESLRANLIDNSWNDGATGIVHDQQNNGANNGIGAATAVHADVTGGTGLDTGATATSTSVENISAHFPEHLPDRDNEIIDTMNGFVGSATLQQNNGDNNAINAATALDGVDGDADGIGQSTNAGAAADSGKGFDAGAERENLIDPSFNGAAGVFTVQQNNGNGNGISAATAAVGVTGNGGSLSQSAEASGEGLANTTDASNSGRINVITDSFNEGFAGVATVQQNNGNYNGIAAATSVAGVGGNTDSLDQVTAANESHDGTDLNKTGDANSERRNSIGGGVPAFNGAVGVVTVQQNNGDANGMAAATAVAGVAGNGGAISQDTFASRSFTGAYANSTDNFGGLRGNTINSNSFDNATGVFTVQQNNGDANSIASATSVAGVAGDSDKIDQTLIGGSTSTGSQQNGERGVLKAYGAGRYNDIIDTLNGVSGVTTVQQNNGNANQIDNATGLVAVGGTSGDVTQELRASTGSATSMDNRTETLAGERSNFMEATLWDYDGILTVQQNNGDANAMSTKTGVIFTDGSGTVDQTNFAGNTVLFNNTYSDTDHRRSNILSSMAGNLEGVATVQQNNGDANGMIASTGLVFAAGEAGDTSQDVIADGFSGRNILLEVNGTRTNGTWDSFTNARGIVTVQQNNGDGNAMTALTSAAANQGGDDLDTSQDVRSGGTVEGNTTLHELGGKPARENDLSSSSFQNLQGIATVQQNNGNGNSIGSSTGVIANFGDGLMDDVTKQDVTTDGSVSGSYAAHNLGEDSGRRSNYAAVGIFDNSNGIVTVQQNNGDNNAIDAATGVRAEIGATAQTNPDEEDVSTQLAGTSGAVSFNEAESVNIDPTFSDRINVLGWAFQGGVNGVFSVQQNNGDNNAIGSATAVVADINNEEDVDSALNNRATTVGLVEGNLGKGEFGASDTETGRTNEISRGLFDDGAGIITAQQNNGNNNVMGAATGVAANVNTEKRFGKQVNADADGTATVDTNSALASKTSRLNQITLSFVGTQGVMTVQQNNGDNNVIGAATDVVASTELPGFGPAASTSTLGATVSGNTAEVIGAENLSWDNLVNGSFTGASGIMTVQQNNGNNNGMGSAITAVANGINFGFNPAP